MYAHKIISRNIHKLLVGSEKLLIDIGVEEEPDEITFGQLVPVQGSRQMKIQQVATYMGEYTRTFAYVPTTSPAPLAFYLGTPMTSALPLYVQPSEKLLKLKHE